MARIWIGTLAALFAVVGGASAADLSTTAYTKAPAATTPAYNWNGFYGGLNAGYSWGKASGAGLGSNLDGGLGGGQVGFNWQLDRGWVAGLEGDIQGTGERGSGRASRVGASFPSFIDGTPDNSGGADFDAVPTQTMNSSYELGWFATFRGRAGVLADPQTLLYGTGGLAVGQFKYTAQTSTSTQLFNRFDGSIQGPPIVGSGAAMTNTDTRVGWTLGAGAERKFTPNWSAKVEYLYLDFGSKTYFGGTTNQAAVHFHDHILRAGINYGFNLPSVAAK